MNIPSKPAIASVQKSGRIKLEHIILATDFSQPASKTASCVLKLAHHYGASVEIVQGFLIDVPTSVSGYARGVVWENVRQQRAHFITEPQFMRQLASVEHRFLIDPEAAVRRLTWIFRRQEPCLVAVSVPSSSGKTLLLDPQIEILMSVARSPRLMFGPRVASSVRADQRFAHILYGCDLTPDSLAAGRYALTFTQEFQSRLTLLNVFKSVVTEKANLSNTLARIHEWLGERVPSEARLWSEISTIVEFGNTAGRILHVAERECTDLIVLGWDISKDLVSSGSVAREVIENARCPVLLVPSNLDAPAAVSESRNANFEDRVVTVAAA